MPSRLASPLVALLGLLGLACSNPIEVPFTPAEGEWTVGEADVSVVGCGSLADFDLFNGFLVEGETFELVLGPEDGSFSLRGTEPVPGTEDPVSLSCSLLANRMDYLCDPVEEEITFSLDDLAAQLPASIRDLLEGLPSFADLTFSLAIEVDGTFVTERSGAGSASLTIDCRGLLCAGLETDSIGIEFPCSLISDAPLDGPPEEG
ncbi:MAG: hypothetical protein ACFCGT_01470 [Sandaracinaceae bacterium]